MLIYDFFSKEAYNYITIVCHVFPLQRKSIYFPVTISGPYYINMV